MTLLDDSRNILLGGKRMEIIADPEKILSSLEKTIKSVGMDIRKTNGGADKINRLAALVNSYSRLVSLCVGLTEANKPNAYDVMEREARRSIGH